MGGGVEGWVHDIQVQKPLEQQVILQSLAELALAPCAVEGHHRHSFSRCSGGKEGRPTLAYMRLKMEDSSANASGWGGPRE